MTADVNANVNVNVSTIETEDKCGLDMSEHEGLPTTAADCNGYRNGNETGKGNAEDDPDASYIFVAGTDAVAEEPAGASNLNGKSEPIEKVGSRDVDVDNDAAELVVDQGGSPMKNELPLNDEKEETNGAVEVPNGCQGAIEADQDEVDLNTVVEQSKEFQINDLEPDSENKPLEVSINGEKAEEDDNIGSTVTEESQVTCNADIAESKANHSDNVEVENCKNIVESEQSPSSEAEVISRICIAESEQDQPGEAEVICCNNSAESEQSQSGEAEALSSNNIDQSNQSGKVEVSSTNEGGQSELNQSGNTEDMVEVSSKKNLVSNIEENQDSSTTFTGGVQDDNDMDLNHGKESVGFTNNVSKDPQQATSCVVEAGVKLETAEVFDVTLSDKYVNGLSAGCAEDGVAETGVVNGIAAAPQTTLVQNGGSEELERSENLTSSDAEIGISYPAASDAESIKDSKNEFNMSVIHVESEAINGHVTCQNGETLPTDHAEECDSQADFSHSSQTSPKKDTPSQVSEAVSTDGVAIANHESKPVDPVSDTALEVDNGHSCPSDAALEPVVHDGHSHPIHDSETYETRAETVDEKFKAIPSTQSNDAIPETEADAIAIKSAEVPAISSDVVNIESEVSAEAANDFGRDPETEACAHGSVENAVDGIADSEVENSLILPREVPRDDGSASESDLVKNPVDVKAESEVEDSLVVPREVSHDDGSQSESISVENPIDVTAEQVENSSTFPGKLSHADGPASESQVLNDSVHSGIVTHNELQVENKGNQLVSIDVDEKTSEEKVVANADNQGEASASSPEGIDGQNLVVEGGKKPFYYMIKIPRYDSGESLREQIKRAQNQVDEKTKSRDVIRAEMQKQRVCCNEFGARRDDAISEETAARDLLKAKRKEIDSVLLVINKVRSARDVGEIDSKIRNMEHMLQHETLALKEEKSYIRTIQQLKQTREQLSSSLGNQEDVQEALNQKEQVEERLKILRKEADQLRENVFKAEGATKIANKKYQDQKAELNDLTMQFRAADDVRQQAYADLQSLRKQLYDKNKYFWKYKDDAKAAYDLASKGDKDELQSHCINQVERVMELWNNNDEFRKEYIRCNIRSTLRRLRTLDGRSLGPDEEPPVIPYVTERAAKENTVPSISTPEEENTVAPVKKTEKKDGKSPEKKDDKSSEKLRDQIKPTAKSKKPAKPAPGNASATVSQSNEIEEAPQQEENNPTKEEAELIRKAEELRVEEKAAILREQRRLEEKAKAKEALERKKRNADKAQARAALRAQKEAEQKEKEREKKARKKEKRKAVEEVNVAKEAESDLSSEIPPETKVPETGEKTKTQTKRSQKPSQFTKQIKPKSSMPLPLRNRSKRRMQTWMWALVAALLILSIFLVGNGNLSLQRFGF